MITKERLEELIKQGATIWSDTLWYTGKIYLTNNDTDEYQIVKDIDNDYVYLNHHKKGTDHIYDGGWCLEDLREDVDRAEWEYKTTAERTERFEPPMWEDIEDKYEFYFTCQDYKSKSSDPCGMFVVNKKGTLKNYILVRNVSHYPNIFTFDEPATKENYIKACEIVRDLFNKGGAK